ncbi:MAG: hypothetical protein IJU28_02950 [Clostridia bacterium]|nr:hypothetical protein [Clostridia bacterium]
MKKKTNEEFLTDLKKINQDIEVLEEYINTDTKIKVKCTKCGKIWGATPNNLLSGHGCGRCANRKNHEQFKKDLAIRNPNIEVLGEYIDAKTPIAVMCKKCGSKWDAKPRQLIGGHGCWQCGIQKQADAQRKSQEQFEAELSSINPNICIIGVYKSSMIPIECKCKRCGYNWNAIPGNLLKGRGCPRCASYLHTSYPEQTLFFYIHNCFPEAINGYKDLFNDGMELDIYIPSRKIGIEYDGKAWHNNEKSFMREIKKYALCRENNIRLVRVKELKKEEDVLTADQVIYSNETLDETLEKISELLGVKFDVNLDRDGDKISEQYQSEDANESFVRKLNEKNPEVIPLSSYALSNEKIQCRCKKCGFEWKATPNKLLMGRGCPKCSKRMKKDTTQFREELKLTNPDIEVIGEYYNISSPIRVKCKICDYEWTPIASSILRGNGCPRCSHCLQITHEQFVKELKQINDSIDVLGKYSTKRTPIRVRCLKCGREWIATPDNLLRNHGCAKCAGILKKTTEEFAQEIQRINSKFIVEGEYINARTKIKVVCKECGYERIAVPYSLLGGLRCPNCDKNL